MYVDKHVANVGIWNDVNDILPNDSREVMILFENNFTHNGSYYRDEGLWYDDGMDGGTIPYPFTKEFQDKVIGWRPLLEGEG